MSTLSNLVSHDLPLDAAAPLLAKALNDKDGQVRSETAQELSSLGRQLSDEQADEFELQIDTNYHHPALRLLLVAYYLLGQRRSTAAKDARRSHILWLIEHAADFETTGKPDCSLLEREDPDGYRQAKSLWLANIDANPDNPSILANAASFFTLNDPTLSERLLKQGMALEPDNPAWHEKLGHLYALSSRGKRQDGNMLATKSFAAFEEAAHLRETQQSSETPKPKAIMSRIHSLCELARSALDACEFEWAANYASELLALSKSTDLPEFFRNDGNAVHYGNLVLGRVALEMGNVEDAKRHLMDSGRTQGSPNLMSFGPNMSLARGLLECGEREVVLEYFQLCMEFWEHGAEKLKTWTEQVKAGNIPDFEANFVY